MKKHYTGMRKALSGSDSLLIRQRARSFIAAQRLRTMPLLRYYA